MRIRNKELRQRWHRKKQRIMEIKKELIAQAESRPKAEKVAKKPAPKKPAAVKAETDKPKRSPKKKAEGGASEAESAPSTEAADSATSGE